ncbi:ABC transporter ATP-binding protein/permease [Curtobacterium flaccumfaciens pv. flaccumfaciens]|uniref:ABC transporter ATP-binding protein n=1 Tax=Curtobacterium TaxID=2034 RepID=UPI000DA73B66|nr:MULTISPECIES: ABC transporter ATP-binding protein [Curtobacterium]MBF4628988.1 ABC transporter ATP-binding protein [Curtobacterium flaccumfaciens]MBT1681921.1 ABC transporter ATP-binding protein/permease [Curtobacterium flaccumfaciens pv. flaccumfaciens]MCS6569351.1 ABC transporter ATP-binding protein/permease [Curtobacterium flaccumfaciens pv. flaccumfaciens]MCS6583799.1 ABC transporter ATP-binding protein/permease [Curtobacterium flaccumfaciens pv. flaccumfaciens]WIB44549.1 ABC transporte
MGVRGEEREDFTKAESKRLRRRSLALLGSLAAPLKLRLVLLGIVVVVSTAGTVAGPALIAWGIDNALPAVMDQNDWVPAFGVVATYIVVAVLGAVLTAWYTVLAARISQAILFDLRKRVFLHTQRLSLEFHETYTSGRIISRQTSDLDSIRELLDSGLNQLIQGVLYMAFTAVALVLLDPTSGLVLAVSLVPLWFLIRWFQTNSQTLFRSTRVTSARVIVHFVETMTGIRAVQAFRKESRNRDEYGGYVEDYRVANTKVFNLFGTFDPVLVLIGNATLAAVVIVGGFRIVGGTLEVGALLAVALYAKRFFDPAQELAMFYNGYQSASAAMEKISGVLEERPSVPDPAKPTRLADATGKMDFDDVVFAYNKGKVVLPEFDLHIPSGQTIALVGSTGAGKSTLAKLMARFYDPTQGSVKLDGVDLRDLDTKDMRRAIVMVTQEAYLFSGTVADNIALGKPGASREEIEASAKAVGAHEFIMALPDGYDTDVNKRGGRVSAGQRQLLSFARAFIADPKVLILDEATASLDIPSERLVQEGLETLLADRTAVIIAHRLSTVAIAHRVLVMEHGRIVEDGTPADLIAGTGRFAQLHAAWRDSLV